MSQRCVEYHSRVKPVYLFARACVFARRYNHRQRLAGLDNPADGVVIDLSCTGMGNDRGPYTHDRDYEASVFVGKYIFLEM